MTELTKVFFWPLKKMSKCCVEQKRWSAVKKVESAGVADSTARTRRPQPESA